MRPRTFFSAAIVRNSNTTGYSTRRLSFPVRRFPALNRRWCPVSEVRDTPQHTLTRTSETKGHQQLFYSSAAFRFEVPNRVCCRWCRNFKSAALVLDSNAFDVITFQIAADRFRLILVETGKTGPVIRSTILDGRLG